VVQERIHCHDEWSYGIEQCWKKEIELLTDDIAGTIEFLRNDCTADEYIWISEVLEEVVEIIPNKEFVQVYKSLRIKFPEEYATYNIAGCVEEAEKILEWEDQNVKKFC
jgi:hypothetical protein